MPQRLPGPARPARTCGPVEILTIRGRPGSPLTTGNVTRRSTRQSRSIEAAAPRRVSGATPGVPASHRSAAAATALRTSGRGTRWRLPLRSRSGPAGNSSSSGPPPVVDDSGGGGAAPHRFQCMTASSGCRLGCVHRPRAGWGWRCCPRSPTAGRRSPPWRPSRSVSAPSTSARCATIRSGWPGYSTCHSTSSRPSGWWWAGRTDRGDADQTSAAAVGGAAPGDLSDRRAAAGRGNRRRTDRPVLRAGGPWPLLDRPGGRPVRTRRGSRPADPGTAGVGRPRFRTALSPPRIRSGRPDPGQPLAAVRPAAAEGTSAPRRP